MSKANDILRRYRDDKKCNFSVDKNLSGEDFQGEDLSGFNFSGCDLSGANFCKATLTGTDFSHCIIRGTNFEGAELTSAKFIYWDKGWFTTTFDSWLVRPYNPFNRCCWIFFRINLVFYLTIF